MVDPRHATEAKSGKTPHTRPPTESGMT